MDLETDLQANGEGSAIRIGPVRVFRIGTGEACALEGEQVLAGQVHAGAGHAELLEQVLGKLVPQLDLTELGVGAVLHEVGAGAAFVAGIVRGKGRDGGSRIGGRPGVQHAVALVGTRIGNAEEVGLELLVVIHVLSGDALPEHAEVEVLIGQFDVQAPGKVRNGREDPGLVPLVDDAVTVQVGILETAHAGILLTAGEDFLPVLVQASTT